MTYFTEKKIRQIYDGFQNKNMPFEEFRKQVIEKTDPMLMGRDAMEIARRKRMIDIRNN